MDNKNKPSNKKESSNKNHLPVIMNKSKYFLESAKVSLILAIVLGIILITQRQADYFAALLSSNTALLAIFIKIEWDEYKEKKRNNINSKRLILAYYNELKNMQLVFKQNKYRLKEDDKEDDVDFYLIDKKMEESAYKEEPIDVSYNKLIKKEILRGLHNLEILEVRLNNHKRLEKSIKNMLLETDMTVSENLFEELWKVQENYHEIYIKPINYGNLRETIERTGYWVLKNPIEYYMSFDGWNEMYKSLNDIDINVKLDKDMEFWINNMMEKLDENK
ncbi:TPA: hypothetical protein PBY39_002360 [Staphylococcus aureus]|nr:hypothetical protein [Staphylococcus aureus]